MKKTFLLIALISSITCIAQPSKKWRGNYLLNGTVENTSVAKVKLTYTADTRRGLVTDTLYAVIGEGKFSFSGFMDEPIFATLTVDAEELHFFIDPSVIQLDIAENNRDFVIKGSQTSDEYLEIEELRKGFAKKNEKELFALYEKKNEKDNNLKALEPIESQIAKLESQADLSALTFSSKDRNSFAVLKALDDFLESENKYYNKDVCTQMMRIYAQMPESIKDTPTGINVSGKLLKARINLQF